jgi:hypothetical protein
MRLRRILLLVFVISTTVIYAKKDKDKDWKTGKVLDSQAVKTRAGVAATAEGIPTIRDTDLMILGEEFAYVIEDTRVTGKTSLVGLTERAISNRHHGCRFIVGDDVKYYQERAVLHVLDADNKECKVEVLRQERLKPSGDHGEKQTKQ